MSVDSVYFLADLYEAQQLWHQPISEVMIVAEEWSPPNERAMGMLRRKGVETVVRPMLKKLADENPSDASLGELGIAAAKTLLKLSAAPKRGILGPGKAWTKAFENAFSRAVNLLSLYVSVIEFNRKGPITELGNTRETDMGFAEFLERYMPKEEASKYNGSATYNHIGPAMPSEFASLPVGTVEKLELRAMLPSQIDASLWLERWRRLEEIPGLWHALAEDGMRQVDINHIKGVGDLCRFAVDNSLAMFKVIT